MPAQYTEGQSLLGSDGKVYVVRNGQPVPKSNASPQTSVGPTAARSAVDQAERDRQAASDHREQARFDQQQREWNATHNLDGSPKDAEGGLSPEAVTFNADQYLTTGVMPTLGMGKQAAKDREKILNAAAIQAGAAGLKGPDLARQIAHYKAGTKQIATLENQLGLLRGSEGTALTNGQQFLDRSRELPGQTSFPLLNSVVQTAQRWLPVPGHDTIAAADVAQNTFANEYARVISQTGGSGGVLSDSARHEAMSILRGNFSPEKKQAAFNQMKIDMASRLTASHQSINDAYTGLTQKPGYTVPETIADTPGQPGQKKDQANPFAALPGVSPPTPGLYDGDGNFVGQDPRVDYSQAPPPGVLYRYPDENGNMVNSESLDGGPEGGGRGIPNGGTYEQYLKDQLTANGMADPTSANNYGARAQHGLLASLDDEIAGIGGGLGYALRGKNPLTGYQINRDLVRMRQRQNEGAQGLGGTALEIGASIPTALMMGGGASIGGAALNGARFGAVEGFGQGSGAAGSALGTVGGAIGGTVGGAAGGVVGKYAVAPLARRITNLPLAKSVLNRVTNGRFEPVPNPTPLEGALNKIEPDTAAVRDRLQQASDLGVPYSLADASPRLRMLSGKVSRTSPETRQMAENYFEPRNMGQVDRLNGAIDQNLAPITNVADRGKQILDAADQAAGPYYNRAFDRPGPVDPNIAAMLDTPGGRAGLTQARTIAENRQLDPNKMGFELNAQGEPTLKSVPSYETLQLVKRGLDGHLNSFKDLLGNLNLRDNPVAQSVLNLKTQFNNRLGEINPEYAQGNKVWSEYAQRNDALNAGFSDLPKMPPRDVQSYVAGQSPATLAEAQRGYATSMSDRASKLRYTANPWETTYGSPAAQESVGAMFPQGAERFSQHYGLERDMAKAALETLGGSQTAARQSIDNAFNGNLALPAEVIGTLHGAPGAGTMFTKAASWLANRGANKVASKSAATLAPVLFNDANNIGAVGLLDAMLADNAKRTIAANLTARRSGMFGSILAPVPALDSR